MEWCQIVLLVLGLLYFLFGCRMAEKVKAPNPTIGALVVFLWLPMMIVSLFFFPWWRKKRTPIK